MARLRELGLDEVIREQAAAGAPVLGICLGFQLLYGRSEEHGSVDGHRPAPRHRGAAARAGPEGAAHRVERGDLRAAVRADGGLRRDRELLPRALLRAAARRRGRRGGRGDYGGPFVSIAERGTVMGAQFHPEKSSRNGLALLRNFTRICARVAA